MAEERLHKILARAGVASRRACEELITDGHVSVDGETVTELGSKADPEAQDIRVDGSRIRFRPREVWLLNKPKGVVCTNRDPEDRRRAIDLIPQTKARLYTVGRLDADSQGLVLLTNDGDLANKLTHPRYGVPKTYLATVSGKVTGDDVRRLRKGIHLAEGKAEAAWVRVLKRGSNHSVLEIVLREGRNRQIRRMLAGLRHPVRSLVRTRLGRLTLRGLGSGRARPLTPSEVEYLKRLAAGDVREDVKPAKERGTGSRTGPGRGGRKGGRPQGRPSRGPAKGRSPGKGRGSEKGRGPAKGRGSEKGRGPGKGRGGSADSKRTRGPGTGRRPKGRSSPS